MENQENIVIEETTNETTETALTAPEMEEVPEYLVPVDDESCDCDDEESEGMSTKTKALLAGAGALSLGALIGGGILLKKHRDKKLDEKDPEAATRGPKPLSDKEKTVKAIRGRKLTLREKLTGRLYLDPAEVAIFQQIQEMQNQETEENPTAQ